MKTLCIFLTLLLTPLSAFASAWLDSLPAAQQRAAERGNDLLILYKGDEFNKPDESPAPLFHSQHFLEVALPLGFVPVELPAPVQKNDEGRPYRRTAIVFADATGRPYYCFFNEWQNGLDWVQEELKIAAERRAVLKPLWKQMKPGSGDRLEVRMALPLFAAMPEGIQLYYEPYARLHAEALARDKAYCAAHEAREARRKRAERAARTFFSLLYMGGESGVRCIAAGDFGTPEEELRELPGTNVRLHFLRELLLFAMRYEDAGGKRGESWELLQKPVEALLYRCMALAPRSKMARMLRVTGLPQLQANAVAASLRHYRENPQEALATLEGYRQRVGESACMQQFCGLMRARILAELGQWDAAVAELHHIEPLDPVSSQAETVRLLRESIIANRARLEELKPLIRKGNTGPDQEWDSLLELKLGLTVSLNSSDDSLFYESEERAASTLKRAQEIEAAAAASAEEQAFRAELQQLGVTLPQGDAGADIAALRARAEQGELDAQKALYMMYHGGLGVEKDEAEAFVWLRRASMQGDAACQYIIGCLYVEGMVVERDLMQAEYWLRKAAAQGVKEAAEALKQMSAMADPFDE